MRALGLALPVAVEYGWPRSLSASAGVLAEQLASVTAIRVGAVGERRPARRRGTTAKAAESLHVDAAERKGYAIAQKSSVSRMSGSARRIPGNGQRQRG